MDGVLEKVYAAPLDLAVWAEAVESVAAAVGAVGGGQFHIFDAARQRMLYSCMPAWISRERELIYNSRFAATDPRRRLAETKGPGEWIFDQDHFDSRYVSRSELYEFLIGHNMRYSAGATLHASDGVIAALGVFRAPDQQPFASEDRAALARLTAHLMRAANLTMKLAELRRQAPLGTAALDSLADAVFITDARARIVFQNRAAGELLRETSTLSAGGASLRAVNTDDGRAVSKAVANAAATGVGSALTIRDRDGKLALQCRVLRLPETSLLHRCDEQRVLLVFRRIAPASGQVRIAAALYGLTPAETQVTKRLIAGSTPREISSDLGISVTTVRSHLKQVFLKTNTRRQAEVATVFASANLVNEP